MRSTRPSRASYSVMQATDKFGNPFDMLLDERLRLKGSKMRFKDTDPTQPWWNDAEITGSSQVFDLDLLTNIFIARAALGGKPPLKLGASGNYRAGLKPAAFLKLVTDFVCEKFSGRVGYRSYYDDPYPRDTYIMWNEGLLKVSVYDTHADVELITESPEAFESIRSLLKTEVVDAPPQGSVYMMTATNRGPEFHSVGVGGHILERGNYAPAVLEAYDRICEDVKAKTPRGRLSILDGAPGCGKTYLIRGMLNQVTDVLFVVVPPHFLPSLAEPSSLAAVTKLKEEHEKPIVFVVEDADECLARREEGNMSAISMVLNLGDGIIGSVLDVRIVCTTNAKYQDFDPAIKRAGRLTALQTVGSLGLEQAREVYLRLLPGADPEKVQAPMTLAEIYQLAYDAGWKGPKSTEKKKMGFGA